MNYQDIQALNEANAQLAAKLDASEQREAELRRVVEDSQAYIEARDALDMVDPESPNWKSARNTAKEAWMKYKTSKSRLTAIFERRAETMIEWTRGEIIVVSLIGLMFLALTMGAVSSCTVSLIYVEAKSAGVGEYYLDANDNKQWRWKTPQPKGEQP